MARGHRSPFFFVVLWVAGNQVMNRLPMCRLEWNKPFSCSARSGVEQSHPLSSQHYGKYAECKASNECYRFAPGPGRFVERCGLYAGRTITSCVHGKSNGVGVAKKADKHRYENSRPAFKPLQEAAGGKCGFSGALCCVHGAKIVSHARYK